MHPDARSAWARFVSPSLISSTCMKPWHPSCKAVPGEVCLLVRLEQYLEVWPTSVWRVALAGCKYIHPHPRIGQEVMTSDSFYRPS